MLAVALAVLTAGCGGSGGDKAGGNGGGERIVLPLSTPDALYAHDEFAAAVERLSGGSMRIQVRGDPREPDSKEESKVVSDVARGDVPLGIVDVRVWETKGVVGLRGLAAPFLIDSLELQKDVLVSPLAARALESLESIDVIGIALLPGVQLRPFGVSRTLVAVEDYRGARFGIRPSIGGNALLRAFGADVRVYAPDVLAELDGAALDVLTIAQESYDERAHALTSNVVLWPRFQTVFMNRAAFEALTSAQRQVLLRAGREAISAVLADIEIDEAQALDTICERGKLRLAVASDEDLARLLQAAAPVYDELRQNAETRTLIAEIGALRRETPAPGPALRCSGVSTPSPSSTAALEGRWRYGPITPRELLDAGLGPRDAQTLSGTAVFEFADGRFRATAGTSDQVVASGSYDVEGDILRLVFDVGPVLQKGTAYELRWSVYRDALSFSAAPGGDPLLAFIAKPFTRVSGP